MLSSQVVFTDVADVALLARADQYPDTLTGAPLAAALDGPILLTPPDDLAAVVADELVRLGVDRVVLLGGEEALTPAVADAVRDLGIDSIARVAGDTRFDTAAEVASAVTYLTSARHVYVAEGADPDPMRGWPDALSASALAAAQGTPSCWSRPTSCRGNRRGDRGAGHHPGHGRRRAGGGLRERARHDRRGRWPCRPSGRTDAVRDLGRRRGRCAGRRCHRRTHLDRHRAELPGLDRRGSPGGPRGWRAALVDGVDLARSPEPAGWLGGTWDRARTRRQWPPAVSARS